MLTASMQAAEAFLGHAAVQESMAQSLDSGKCEGVLSISFEGQVESDLEAIFCRGPEWDDGLEHLFLFQASHLHSNLKKAPVFRCPRDTGPAHHSCNQYGNAEPGCCT